MLYSIENREEKEMYDSLFVANYIIEYCNTKEIEINNLKLQKLLYYVNVASIVEKDRQLFDEPMEKWKYGPVVPSVYRIYRESGSFQIRMDDIVKNRVKIWNPFGVDVQRYNREGISQDDRDFIDNIVKVLGNLSGFQLVDETHKEKIWSDYEERINSGELGIKYSMQEIKEYFNNDGRKLWQR